MNSKNLHRRTFLFGGSAAVATLPSLARLGYSSPNEKLHTAHIGVGGKGRGHLDHCAEREIVTALCDVDDHSAAEAYEKYQDIPKYKDFRVMLEKQNDIDAVIISTPDHTHAVAAMAAMQLGKHVFVEKPLTHSIAEARELTKAARRYKVATQMGNQGHAMEGVRQTCEMIWSGAIGPVREVHCWTNRPTWPQGVPGPLPAEPVPSHMDWDLWLGPAPERPYNEGYAPDVWRGWWDFGCGALGDMGCHTMDTAFWALHLGAPSSVECLEEEGCNGETGPLQSIIRYEFQQREWNDEILPPVTLYWYDGCEEAPLIEGAPRLDSVNATLFIGKQGALTCGVYGDDPKLLPEEKMQDYKMPDPVLERIPNDSHRDEWLRACKGGPAALSNFDYAGPLTEMVHLGNVALRSGRKIHWNAEAMSVTNAAEANRYVGREYRKGWRL